MRMHNWLIGSKLDIDRDDNSQLFQKYVQISLG